MPVSNPALVYTPSPWSYPASPLPGYQLKSSLLRADVAGAVQLLTYPPYFNGGTTSTTTTVPTATDSTIILDTEYDDAYNGHWTSANRDKWYGQFPGWYLAESSIAMNSSSGTVTAGIGLSVSGAAQTFYYGQKTVASGLVQPVCAKLLPIVNTGPTQSASGVDYITSVIRQNSGSNQVNGLGAWPMLTVRYVSGLVGLASVPGFGVPPIPQNANWDFESSVSPWTGAQGCTVTQDISWAWHGNGAMKMSFSGAATGSGPQALSENTIVISPLTSQSAQAQIYVPLGWNGVQLILNFFNSGGTNVGTATGTAVAIPPGYAAGTLVSVTGTSPATATKAQIVVQFLGNPPAGLTAWADWCMSIQNAGSLSSGLNGISAPTNDSWPVSPSLFTHQFVNKNVRDTVRYLVYPPIMEAYNNATVQTIASVAALPNLGTLVNLDSQTVDTYNGFSPATHLFTVPPGGGGTWYAYGQAGGTAPIATGVALAAGFTITSSNYFGGVQNTLWGGGQKHSTVDTGDVAVTRRRLILNAGDTVGLAACYNDSGAGVFTVGTGSAGVNSSRFIMIRVSN